jgi:S-adenosylhomocysteine hydrolase
MLSITSKLIMANEGVLKQFEYFIVQHLKNDTVKFVGLLQKIGCRISNVIGVSYSVEDTALECLQHREFRVDVKDFTELAAFLREMILLRARPVVLLDVGGYGSGLAGADGFSRFLRFIVEDTKNGLWQYQSIVPHCPIIDVASIENKAVENAFVGRRIVDGLFKFFSEGNISRPMQRNYVVVGFGGIGQSVCSALALKGINAAVVELDERKLAFAEAIGHRIARSIDSFRNAEIVIGCTGTSSVSMEQLIALPCQPLLISGSSKRIEFQDILSQGEFSQSMSDNALVEKRTGATIVNKGEPINLHYGSLNNETSDFMFANITAAIIEGSGVSENKIVKLSDQWQNKICRLWSEYYLRPAD